MIPTDDLQHADPWNGEVARVVQQTGATPKTVANVIAALARFGAIDRPNKPYRLRLTTLGARWWETR